MKNFAVKENEEIISWKKRKENKEEIARERTEDVKMEKRDDRKERRGKKR